MNSHVHLTASIIDLSEPADRESLKQLLSKRIMTIQFVKADGSIRRMRCTRDSKRIPTKAQETQGKVHEDPFYEDQVAARAAKACAVFDLDKGEWRSFRWNSVLSFASELE